jgi:hypothetical protein
MRVTATREAHHREGHELFTVDAVMAEEERIFGMIDESDNRTRLDVRDADLGDLSPDQARAIRDIARSPLCSRCRRPPALAKRTRSRRCAPLRTAPTKRSSFWRRPVKPSTKRCAMKPATAA